MKTIKLSEIIRSKVKTLDPSKYPDVKFNLCSISAFDQGKPEEVLGKEIGSSKKVLIQGDVVISRIVPHIKRVWEVPILNKNIVLGSGEWIVFNSQSVNGGYLRNFLQCEVFHKQFMSTVKGVGGSLLRADPTQTSKILIPLPSLPIQKKITTILDAADLYRQQTKTLIEKYGQLAQSLFLEMFGDPVRNEKGWEIIELSNLVTKLGDGLHSTPIYSEQGDYYFINGNNLDNGKIIFTEATKRLDKSEYFKHRKDLDETTMLVSINGTLGKAAFYNGEKIILGKSACYFNIQKTKINPIYLYNLIASSYFLDYANSTSTGSTIQNVSLKTMRAFPIPLPPLSLQAQFADRIQLIEMQKAQAQAALQKSESMFNSLLQKAFKGELCFDSTSTYFDHVQQPV